MVKEKLISTTIGVSVAALLTESTYMDAIKKASTQRRERDYRILSTDSKKGKEKKKNRNAKTLRIISDCEVIAHKKKDKKE